MHNLKLFRVLLDLVNKARSSGMTPSEVAGCFLFAREMLGEDESGRRPGYVAALKWIEERRSMYVARLNPGRPNGLS